MPGITVIIPAFNEENAVGRVIADIPRDLVGEVVVVNNNSNDQTAAVARQAGATVLDEPRQGYGRACLKGIAHVRAQAVWPEIIVFLDADYSDYPEELRHLVAPIREQGMDLVIGSRALGERQRGSITPQQLFGNWLATRLIRGL